MADLFCCTTCNYWERTYNFDDNTMAETGVCHEDDSLKTTEATFFCNNWDHTLRSLKWKVAAVLTKHEIERAGDTGE
jgi:hypothetical protein